MRKSMTDAKEAITDMPPRTEEELDSVGEHALDSHAPGPWEP